MIVFNIEAPSGEKVKYKLPSTPKEITCARIIEFQQKVDAKKPTTLAEYEALPTAEAKNEYFDSLDPDEINKTWSSHYARELQFWANMSLQDLAKIPLVADDGGADLFVLRGILQKALTNIQYEETDKFMYKGDTYYFPESPPNLIDASQKDWMRGTTLGQFATAHELYKAYTDMQAGSCEALLNVIAVLCLKKGETLPVMADKQADFIRDRVEHLKELDFYTAMNVGFFLTVRMVTSKTGLVSSRAAKSAKRAANMAITLQSVK